MGKKLSDLEAAEALSDDDLFLTEQGGVAKKTFGSMLKKLLGLSVATATILGGVKPVGKTEDMTQDVGVDDSGKLWTAPGGGSGGVSSWEKLKDRPFGDVAYVGSYTHSGVQYNEYMAIERMGDVPKELKYLYNGVVTLATGEALLIYPEVFGHEQAIPATVTGAYLAVGSPSVPGLFEIKLANTAYGPAGTTLAHIYTQGYEPFGIEPGVYCDLHSTDAEVHISGITYTVYAKLADEFLPIDLSNHIPSSVAISVNLSAGTFTDTLDDGRVIDGKVAFNEDGYPESITYDGMTVPITWEEE